MLLAKPGASTRAVSGTSPVPRSRVSVELGARGTLQVMSMPAMPLNEFVSNLRASGRADFKKLLEVSTEKPVGLRNRAIVLTLILSGRRRGEVLGLQVGDLNRDGDGVYYHCRHGRHCRAVGDVNRRNSAAG